MGRTACAWLTWRQRWRVLFGRRINQQLGRWPPDCPHPKGAERKARLGCQCGQAMRAALAGGKCNLHCGAALGGHVSPGPMPGRPAVQHAQSDTVAGGAPVVCQLDINRRCSTRKMCARCLQFHSKSAQRTVADMHADQRTASQQKCQQIAQIELVVDRCHQQREQRHAQHQARAGGQDIHRPLAQGDLVAQRQAVFKPGAKAGLKVGCELILHTFTLMFFHPNLPPKEEGEMRSQLST